MEQLYGKYNMSFEQLGYVVSELNRSSNSYNYLINLKNGDYVISEAAIERFGFPAARGTDYFKINEKMIYPEDEKILREDIEQLTAGKKDVHDMRYRWLNTQGEIVWISCRGRVIKDSEGKPALLIGRIAELGSQAEADDMTGLLNVNRFEQLVIETLCSGERMNGSIIYVGVDDLRSVNELYGRGFGSHIIKNVSECIMENCGPKDKLYRTTGDGFLVHFPEITEEDEIVHVYKQIRRSIDAKIESEEYIVMYTISAGIVTDIKQFETLEQLQQYSEFSLKEAKRGGRNTFYVFEPEQYCLSVEKSSLRKRLHKAIQKNFYQFEVFYQPIVDGKNHRVCGAEALLRWKDEDGKYVSPAKFVPVLEESGHIIPVGRWVLENALKTCHHWIEQVPDFHMNVNLSYVQVEKSDVAELIGELLEKEQTPKDRLIIEITESGYIETGSHFQKFHSKIREMGCRLAIDDFGTGYSNLRYMNEIEACILKIDRSFTQKAMEDENDYDLVQSIVQMAHNMNIKVCIEGIETKEELEKLSRLEPDYFQGYYFGRPVNKTEFEAKNLG